MDLDRLTICAPMFDTDPCVMLWMRAASFTRANGRGVGPGNREFSGPYEMTHLGPKKPKNLPLVAILDPHEQPREPVRNHYG
jgi:hypothetical protein